MYVYILYIKISMYMIDDKVKKPIMKQLALLVFLSET